MVIGVWLYCYNMVHGYDVCRIIGCIDTATLTSG